MLRYVIGITFVTAVIIIVRALTNGKVLKKHQYAFWLIIPLYMILMPFIRIDVPAVSELKSLLVKKTEITYEAPVPKMPAVDVDNNKVKPDEQSKHAEVNELDNKAANPENLPLPANNNVSKIESRTKNTIKTETLLGYIACSVSAFLVLALLVYNAGFITYCRHKREYAGKDPSGKLKIYRIKHRGTPFLLFNKIYVDKDIENLSEYVICHEACHYKHGDHIWVLVRYLVLLLNWYNPVIWAAFILSGQDCELACDEEVLRTCSSGSAKEYAKTLFSMLQRKTGMSFGFTVSTGMRGGYKMMKNRISSIKKPAEKSKKALAFSIAVLLLFTSCSFANSSDNTGKISKNTPWFTSETYDIDLGLKKDRDIYYPNLFFLGADEKYYVVCAEGSYVEENADLPTFEEFLTVKVINRNTKQTVNTVNIKRDLDKNSGEYINTEASFYMDGKITVKTNSNERDYDPATGNLLDSRPLANKDAGWDSRFFKIGNYRIETALADDEGGLYHTNVVITSPDGKSSLVELNEPGNRIYSSVVLALNDTTVLIPAISDKGNRYYELDLTTNKLTTGDEKNYSWFDPNELTEAFTGTNGEVYCRTLSGLARVNVSAKKVEDVFTFNWCGINRGKVSDLKFIECTGDTIIMFGQTSGDSEYESIKKTCQIVEFTKAKKNPNAGKTVLELYAPYVTNYIGEAIARYNDTNKNYFIEVVDRYNQTSNYSESQVKNLDDTGIIMLNSELNMSNALAKDIISGKGPDILINTSNYGQLNNPDYLMDLTPYVKDLDPDKYYTNIIEGAKRDGVIYQLPVGFVIEGIKTDEKYAGKTGVGFTLDEYKSLVDGVLNGENIMYFGQAILFAKLFNAMDDKFIVNGKADLTGPEFAALADYVKNNVPKDGVPYGEFSSGLTEALNYAEYDSEIQGYRDYFDDYADRNGSIKNPTVLGIPSVDGRGPRYSSNCSVAISKETVDADACGEFVKMLLSDELQTYLAMNDTFVLNRNASQNAGEAAVNYFNTFVRKGSTYYVELNNSDINKVEQTILNCSRMRSDNSSISMILIEEMPAYFLGQKDLDAVIKIAQNRIQKVIDERG